MTHFYCLCIANLSHSEEQSSVKVTINKIQTGNVILHSQAAVQLTAIQESIQQLKTALTTQMSGDSGTIGLNPSKPLIEIQQVLSSILARLDNIPKLSKMEESILRRLHFPQMRTREETVGKAEFDTFNWFLDLEADLDVNTPDNSKYGFLNKLELNRLEQARRQFLEWLETGNLVYHISGKAGSGKSTLMKFLYHHPRVKELLLQWAGPKKLVIGGFFFWSSGAPEEKSLAGLYQSILFQILQQCPELLRQTFPQYWAKDSHNLDSLGRTPFQLSELRRAMELLVSHEHTTHHRFFFFIDGLDEFEVDLNTDYRDLAEDVLSWAQSFDVKLCVSSRPYVEFFEGFPASQRIALHDLTRADLRRFVSGALSKEPASDDGLVSSLSRTITDRADGVFLWVRLVVRSVVEGMRHRYPHHTLLQRVKGLPRSLEPLYARLFESIDPLDRPRSDMMLLIALSVNKPLNALLYSWIDDLLDPEFPFNLATRSYTEEEVLSRNENVKFQLYGLSKGLLEIRQRDVVLVAPYFMLDVDFMHRTVRDFLKKPETIQTMVQRSFGSENAELHIRRSVHRLFHAEFKFAGVGSESDHHYRTWRHHDGLENSFRQLLEVRISLDQPLGVETSRNTWEVEARVLEAHGSVLSQYTQEATLSWGRIIHGRLGQSSSINTGPRDGVSFKHYLAARIEYHEYMRLVVTKMTKDLLAREGPSLLLASTDAVIYRAKLPAGHVPLYSHLLEAGVSPNGEFPMVRDMAGDAIENLMVTPWLALLRLRACDLIASPYYREGGFGRSVEDSKARFWPIIEALLAFGADPDVFFDFGLFPPGHVGDPPGRNDKGGDELDDLVSVSLTDLVLVERPSNQAAVLDRISGRRGCWFWGSMDRAAAMLPPWVGARYGLPKLEPGHRRVSVAELEEYVKMPPRIYLRRVYTRRHDITNFDSYMLY